MDDPPLQQAPQEQHPADRLREHGVTAATLRATHARRSQIALREVQGDTSEPSCFPGPLVRHGLYLEAHTAPVKMPATPITGPRYPRPKAGYYPFPGHGTSHSGTPFACHVMLGSVHMCDGGGAGAQVFSASSRSVLGPLTSGLAPKGAFLHPFHQLRQDTSPCPTSPWTPACRPGCPGAPGRAAGSCP